MNLAEDMENPEEEKSWYRLGREFAEEHLQDLQAFENKLNEFTDDEIKNEFAQGYSDASSEAWTNDLKKRLMALDPFTRAVLISRIEGLLYAYAAGYRL